MDHRTFYFCLVLICAAMLSCGQRENAVAVVEKDTVVVHDTVVMSPGDWQEGFGLTHDPDKDTVWKKPVSYYLKNPGCDPLAKDFYYGVFRPGDNHATAHLLGLVTTDDPTLRPFYRWILNKTIQVQDGALGEYTGVPARLYAEKFPKEFFEYMDGDSTGQRYGDWVGAIGYSGYLGNEEASEAGKVRQAMVRKMKAGYSSCPVSVGLRIERFAADCFH